MKELRAINCLRDYAEALVKPLRVLVVDIDPASFDKITNALAPFDAEVINATCACPAAICLQKLSPFDLIFVGVPLTAFGTPDLVIGEIQRSCPDASVVIMAKNPADEAVLKVMEMGPFTFLKKNGNFDSEHVRRIASQLNLKLRPSGKAAAENEVPATARVDRV